MVKDNEEDVASGSKGEQHICEGEPAIHQYWCAKEAAEISPTVVHLKTEALELTQGGGIPRLGTIDGDHGADEVEQVVKGIDKDKTMGRIAKVL